MITKICKKCSSELPSDSGFYLNDSSCKDCRKKRVRENRRNNIEYYRDYDRKRANNADRVLARKIYSMTPEGIEAGNRAKNKWTQKNENKRKASSTVNNAIRDKKLTKPNKCECCKKQKTRIEGHHHDYSKPMDVMWLCSSCHRKWHKENGEGKSA
jgi:transposase-like protein